MLRVSIECRKTFSHKWTPSNLDEVDSFLRLFILVPFVFVSNNHARKQFHIAYTGKENSTHANSDLSSLPITMHTLIVFESTTSIPNTRTQNQIECNIFYTMYLNKKSIQIRCIGKHCIQSSIENILFSSAKILQ